MANANANNVYFNPGRSAPDNVTPQLLAQGIASIGAGVGAAMAQSRKNKQRKEQNQIIAGAIGKSPHIKELLGWSDFSDEEITQGLSKFDDVTRNQFFQFAVQGISDESFP